MNLSHIKGLHRARILRNHPELRLNLACGRNTKLVSAQGGAKHREEGHHEAR